MVGPLPVREDFGADALGEMRAHYAAVAARLLAPRHVERAQQAEVVERPLITPDEMAEMARARRVAAAAAEADRQFRAILDAADNTVIVASRFKNTLRTVDAITGISGDAILGRRRTPHVVKARQIYMWACCRFLRVSAAETGRRCGGRDHTTTLHALRRIKLVVAKHELVLPDDLAGAVSLLWAAEWPPAGRP